MPSDQMSTFGPYCLRETTSGAILHTTMHIHSEWIFSPCSSVHHYKLRHLLDFILLKTKVKSIGITSLIRLSRFRQLLDPKPIDAQTELTNTNCDN